MSKIMSSFRIAEAASKIGVSTKTLRRWEESGKLIPRRSSGGHRYYPEKLITPFIKSNEVEKSNVTRDYVLRTIKKPRQLKKSDNLFKLALATTFMYSAMIISGSMSSSPIFQTNPTKPERQSSVLASSDDPTTPSVSDFVFGVNVHSRFSDTVTFQKDVVGTNIVYSVNGETGDVITIDGSEITNTSTPDYSLSGWTDNGTSITLTTTTDTVTIDTLTAGAITAIH